MSFDADTLWNLLPAHLRRRDFELANPLGPDKQGQWKSGPLRELIGVLAEQVAVLEDEQEQLYENLFVETAAAWALPYLGDLVGLRGLGGAGASRRLAPRAEVANTLAYRRRKGTAAILEQLARDATGWPAAAVEFFQRLATTQNLNHPRLKNLSWLSLREAGRLEFMATPFEDAARTGEVRRIRPGLGQWNIPNVGIFLWRLQAYSRTRSPLVEAAIGGATDRRHFRLHPLGLDVPLCLNPRTETDISHLAKAENVPLLLTRRFLAGARLMKVPAVPGQPAEPVIPAQFHLNTRFYGTHSESSLLIERPGATAGDPPLPVAAHEILVCDLHDVHEDGDPTKPIIRWGHDVANLSGGQFPGLILLDPQRGRVVFPSPPPGDPLGTFFLLFSADLGGGEYSRTASFDRDSEVTESVTQIRPRAILPADRPLARALSQAGQGNQLIEIGDSDLYVETLPALKANDRSLEVRADDEAGPALMLEQPLQIGGNQNGSVTLNGLLVTGGAPSPAPIEVLDPLGKLRVRHCTLLPGLTITETGQLSVTVPRLPALTVSSPTCDVTIENSIVGPIRVGTDVRVSLKNCLVDAASEDALALGGIGNDPAGIWTLENCTVIGNVSALVISLASNCIFLCGSVTVDRRQEGCVRFCWLPVESRVPRRHRCLPREKAGTGDGPDLGAIRPYFTSLRYGQAGYGQLSTLTPEPLRRGADDESEPGVFHDLFPTHREAHLRARLDEYLRFGLEAGIFHAS